MSTMYLTSEIWAEFVALAGLGAGHFMTESLATAPGNRLHKTLIADVFDLCHYSMLYGVRGHHIALFRALKTRRSKL